MKDFDEKVEEFCSFTFSKHIPLAEYTRLRQMLYRFFASLFLYPDEERLTTLNIGAKELLQLREFWFVFPFSTSLNRLLEVLSGYNLNNRKLILNEYNSLFLIKPQAPPHESFYTDLEGQFRGWISAGLQGEYAESGLAMSPTLNELPDHLAVELEYLSFLCDKEARSREKEIEDTSRQFRELQRRFLGKHLGQWFTKFMKRVKDANPDHLYNLVLEALNEYLLNELVVLQLQ